MTKNRVASIARVKNMEGRSLDLMKEYVVGGQEREVKL